MDLLILEPSFMWQQVFHSELRREDIRVDVATSRWQAIERLGMTDYQCLIMEISLPDGNGLDVLRVMPRAAREIIIFTDTAVTEELRRKAQSLGVSRIYRKSGEITQLLYFLLQMKVAEQEDPGPSLLRV